MRPVKLGAKNWLFFGSKDAGHQAAVIYTLVENCRRHGVPVEAYLCELLTRLPVTTDGETIASLTPSLGSDVAFQHFWTWNIATNK